MTVTVTPSGLWVYSDGEGNPPDVRAAPTPAKAAKAAKVGEGEAGTLAALAALAEPHPEIRNSAGAVESVIADRLPDGSWLHQSGVGAPPPDVRPAVPEPLAFRDGRLLHRFPAATIPAAPSVAGGALVFAARLHRAVLVADGATLILVEAAGSTLPRDLLARMRESAGEIIAALRGEPPGSRGRIIASTTFDPPPSREPGDDGDAA